MTSSDNLETAHRLRQMGQEAASDALLKKLKRRRGKRPYLSEKPPLDAVGVLMEACGHKVGKRVYVGKICSTCSRASLVLGSADPLSVARRMMDEPKTPGKCQEHLRVFLQLENRDRRKKA